MSHVPTWIWILVGVLLVLAIMWFLGVKLDVGTSDARTGDYPCMACW